MILWSINEKELNEVKLNDHVCSNCENKGLLLTIYQRFFDIWWIPLLSLGKTAETECPNCKNVLDEKEMKPEIKSIATEEKKKTKTPKKYYLTLPGIFGIMYQSNHNS